MAAKIILSDQELALMQDQQWILTKQQITEKIYNLFGAQVSVIETALPHLAVVEPNWKRVPAKIYKGESYRRFPYVMLDYPRLFSGDDALAIRTLFWWGHFISVSVQLSGKYKRFFNARNGPAAWQSQWLLWTHETPWEHDPESFPVIEWKSQYREACAAAIRQLPYIKLTIRLSLENWQQWETQLGEAYRQIGTWINCPGDETDL